MSDDNRDPFARAGAAEAGSAPIKPTSRRYLTPAECRDRDVPYGAEGPVDQRGNLLTGEHAEQTEHRIEAKLQQRAQAAIAQTQCGQAMNMALGYPLGIYQPGYPTPEAQMRLTCLQMASYAPDGAQAPPVEEVIRRARAYWRFIQTGE